MSIQFNSTRSNPPTPNPPRWWLRSARGWGEGSPRTLKWWWLIFTEPMRGYRGFAHRGGPTPPGWEIPQGDNIWRMIFSVSRGRNFFLPTDTTPAPPLDSQCLKTTSLRRSEGSTQYLASSTFPTLHTSTLILGARGHTCSFWGSRPAIFANSAVQSHSPNMVPLRFGRLERELNRRHGYSELRRQRKFNTCEEIWMNQL